jgi:hypothetical protein
MHPSADRVPGFARINRHGPLDSGNRLHHAPRVHGAVGVKDSVAVVRLRGCDGYVGHVTLIHVLFSILGEFESHTGQRKGTVKKIHRATVRPSSARKCLLPGVDVVGTRHPASGIKRCLTRLHLNLAKAVHQPLGQTHHPCTRLPEKRNEVFQSSRPLACRHRAKRVVSRLCDLRSSLTVSVQKNFFAAAARDRAIREAPIIDA